MYSLYLRQIFSSYQEFKEKLEIYKQETGTDYSIRTSISAETATKRKGFAYIDEVTFPLSYVKFGCVHFGRIRNRGGNKLADNHHQTQNLSRGNCPAFIVISYHSTLKKLVLTSIVHEHDHRLFNVIPKAEMKPPPPQLSSLMYKDSTILSNSLSIIPIRSGGQPPKVENEVFVVGHTQGGCAIILEKPSVSRDVKINNGAHSSLEIGSHSILKTSDVSKRLEMKQPPAVVSIISPKGAARDSSRMPISTAIKTVPEQPQPWDCCYLDIMGPLPKTSAGNTFIVSLTDRCTSWPEAAAIADKHPKFIANFLMDCIGRHGVPKLVASNLDRNFVEKVNETLYNRLGIDKCVTKVSSFGNADFSSATIPGLKSILCQYVSGNDEDWDGYLSLCLLALRTRRHGATNFSPFEALYLHEANLPPSLEARLSLADVHVKPVKYEF